MPTCDDTGDPCGEADEDAHGHAGLSDHVGLQDGA